MSDSGAYAQEWDRVIYVFASRGGFLLSSIEKQEAVSKGIKTQAKPATKQNSKKMAARRKP